MTETTIAFLCKAASILPGVAVNQTQEILKSYYMMRCKVLSKGYGLPQKHFSEQVRCSHCCLEWRKGSEVKLRPLKLSKRQRKRINGRKKMMSKINKEYLLYSNEMERICAFCCHSIKTVLTKPSKPSIVKSQTPVTEMKVKQKKKNEKVINNSKQICNVYSNTVQVFSLNNKKNILQSKIKEEPKIIKNNKKKKDKFAGLCKKAVLASAKFKHDDSKKDKLKLFLKPSS